jgi:hypothetical protein
MMPALRLFGIGLIALSCAGSPKRPEASSPRTKDAASEKIAAQRAAAPSGLRLEQDDERWGIDAARERKREQDNKRAEKTRTAGTRAADVTPLPVR